MTTEALKLSAFLLEQSKEHGDQFMLAGLELARLAGIIAHQRDLLERADSTLFAHDTIIKAAMDVPGVREMLDGVRERAAMRKGE
ncbi:hypothetical protein ACTSKR_11520 [Chitinibacteraceae bacterium HSL-7]